MRAIALYIQYDRSSARAIRELGYPSRKALYGWCREYDRLGDLHDTYPEKSRYSTEQKQAAVEYFLEHGRNISGTVRALGYPNRTLVHGSYLVVSFPTSNAGFVQVFKGQNLECLLTGLITVFTHIGGVPVKLWFDNASTLVTGILKNGERRLTEGFMRFQEHFGFEAVFCNPAAGDCFSYQLVLRPGTCSKQ